MTRLKVETYKARINLFKKKNMEIIYVVIIQ